MQLKKITILTIFIMFLFIASLSAASAANNTIDDTDTGGILQGITNTGNGDTLTLKEGIYNKSSDRGITINENITIQGNTSTNKVIIDAQELNRIFSMANNLDVVFINLTFINGKATSSGGAIYNNYANSTMTFINCTFINNTANYGGVIYNQGVNLSVDGSTFRDNIAGSLGGAIYNSGGMFVLGNVMSGNNATVNGPMIFNNGRMGV